MPLDRTWYDTLVDDDGTGTTGSPWTKADVDALMDAVDAKIVEDGAAGTPSLRTLGTGATQAAAGNDARLSNARTPTVHASSHASGGSDPVTVAESQVTGLVTDLSDLATDVAAKADTTDPRFTDARTPTAHASSHQAGGGDSIKLDDLAAPDDNTDLNASTSAHGLLRKLPGNTTEFLRADGAFATPAGGGGGGGNVNGPATSVVGHLATWNDTTGTTLADGGLVTATKLDDFAAPDDNTDLNVSTSAHGLAPKLPGNTTTFLRGDGSYAAPVGGVLTLLRSGSGTSTAAGATNVDTVAISGLTADDTLVVEISIESVTQDTAAPKLYNQTDGVSLTTLLPTGTLTAGSRRLVDGRSRQHQGSTTTVTTFTCNSGGSLGGNTATVTTSWQGAWTLALRHDGVTAGGTFKWSWTVYKLAGQ